MIEFYFDCSSPWTYLGFHSIQPLAGEFGVKIASSEESRAALDLYERHLLAGARQERSADGRTLRYLDKCENHFLLATAYAALAETLVTETPAVALPAIRPMPMKRIAHNRSLAG